MNKAMPTIQEHVNLAPFNTFAIPVVARYFAALNSPEALYYCLETSPFQDLPKLVLGGGSNVLLTKDIDGMVLKTNMRGIEKTAEDSEHVWLTIGAGENWHNIVMYSINNNLYGIENLSLIPGSMGAAPMQNIGAYGVELKECFEKLDAFDLIKHQTCSFDKTACQFGYRDSLFKHEKHRYFIMSVTLKLKKTREFNIEYKELKEKLKDYKEQDLSLKLVSDAIIAIRTSKLPDPKQLPNAGSFFKNPIITRETLDKLLSNYPQAPYYQLSNNQVKLAAAWLIDQCGFKGKRFDHVGMHAQQALVLINYDGAASGIEILAVAKHIQAAVWNRFSIKLEPEVNII